LQRSHRFVTLASGDALACNYTFNDHDYTMGYYLADDIYIFWSTFVKTIQYPKKRKKSAFPMTQESMPEGHQESL
jgi:hypothetical protein